MNHRPSASWRTHVLYEDAEVRIEHVRRGAPSRCIVVTFDPLLLTAERPAYAQDFLRKLGADQLAVRNKREHFYQPLQRATFDAAARPVLAGYRRRVAYGSSLGAYAALYFCAGGVDVLVASSPRNSSHPVHGVPRWQQAQDFRHARPAPSADGGAGVVVFYDPLDAQDRAYLDAEWRPALPRADWRPMRLAGHPANHHLAEIGFIAPYMRAVVQGRPPPEPDLARRKSSPSWVRELAAHQTRRGRPRWGRALALQALALKPRHPAAVRVLVEAELALGRPEAARAALAGFLAAHPDARAEVAASEHLLAVAAGDRRGWLTRLRRWLGRTPADAADAHAGG